VSRERGARVCKNKTSVGQPKFLKERMARSSTRKTNHRASQLFPRTKYSLTPTPSSCLSHRVCGPRRERHGLRRETGAGQNEHRGGQKKKHIGEVEVEVEFGETEPTFPTERTVSRGHQSLLLGASHFGRFRVGCGGRRKGTGKERAAKKEDKTTKLRDDARDNEPALRPRAKRQVKDLHLSPKKKQRPKLLPQP